MSSPMRWRPLRLALMLTALVALALPGVSVAQNTTPAASAGLVRVETPGAGTYSGAVTFTGYAIDCTTKQAATRVAVYDGPPSEQTYIADVSMDTVRNTGTYCPGSASDAAIGFTLIYDSRRLADGRHTLTFVAHFPSGATAATTTDLTLANRGGAPSSAIASPAPSSYSQPAGYGSSAGMDPSYYYYGQYGYSSYADPYYFYGGYPYSSYGGYYGCGGYRADSPRARCNLAYGVNNLDPWFGYYPYYTSYVPYYNTYYDPYFRPYTGPYYGYPYCTYCLYPYFPPR